MIHYPKRILIVEDNKADVRLLKDILERRGYETLQTSGGFEAINLAVAYLPDLILMDIQLPEISGLDVTRRLKGDDRSRHISIVAVTAFAVGWYEGEALDSGCDAYIAKPISIRFSQSPPTMSMVVRLYAPRGPHTALDASHKLCQRQGIPPRSERSRSCRECSTSLHDFAYDTLARGSHSDTW